MSDSITINSDVCQWYLIIDHEKIPIGEGTCLTVPGTLTVGDLKTRIKEKERNDLAQVDACRLAIFGCTDSSINFLKDDKDAGDEGMALNKVNKAFSNQMVEKLDIERTVASVQILNRTLIVQVPGTLHATFLCSVLKCLANTDVEQIVRKRDYDDDDDDDDSPEIRRLKKEINRLMKEIGSETPSNMSFKFDIPRLGNQVGNIHMSPVNPTPQLFV